MTHEAFERVLQEQLSLCTDILCKKSKEYSTDSDKLHNFKTAAAVQGITQIQALSGMMAKHTVSIYDMCASGKSYPISLWEEKITDSINYLLLLKGIIVEEADKLTTDCSHTIIAPEASTHSISQAEYEELFAPEPEAKKTDYSKWTNKELSEKVCKGAAECAYGKCPLVIIKDGVTMTCTPFSEQYPELFREVAIGVLEEANAKK